MYKALMGWNPKPSQMNPVLAAGKDYSNHFIHDINKDY
jgi:hypothetical protein